MSDIIAARVAEIPCPHTSLVVRTITPQSVQTTCATPVHFAPMTVTICDLCGAKLSNAITFLGAGPGITVRYEPPRPEYFGEARAEPATPWGRCNDCSQPIEPGGSFTHCRRCVLLADALHDLSKVRSELETARAAQQKLTDAVQWALGENGEFPEADEALYEVIARGKKAMRDGGYPAPRVLRLYYWRNELGERAFGPSSPQAATESYDVAGLEAEPGFEMSREKAIALGKRVGALGESSRGDELK